MAAGIGGYFPEPDEDGGRNGYWNTSDGATQRAALESKIQTFLASTYTDSLDQYGISPPTYRGSLTFTNYEPLSP